MWCDPTDNEDVTNVAVPPDIIPAPSVVGGLVIVSLNCTVPDAVDGDTVAVKVTDWPNTVEAVFELRIVVERTDWEPGPLAKADINPIGANSDPDKRSQTSEIPNIFTRQISSIIAYIHRAVFISKNST